MATLSQEGFSFSGSATAAVANSRGGGPIMGGYYMLSAVCGAWNSASIEVQMLGPDGSTYLSLPTAFKLSANGTIYGYLPPGTYQWTVSGSPTDPIKASFVRMPLG